MITYATSWELWFLRTSISKTHFHHFYRIDKGSLPDLLYEACYVIDAMGEKAVNEVRNWFCNFILEPYRKLFTPGTFSITSFILLLLRSARCSFRQDQASFCLAFAYHERFSAPLRLNLPLRMEPAANDSLWVLPSNQTALRRNAFEPASIPYWCLCYHRHPAAYHRLRDGSALDFHSQQVTIVRG